MAGFDRLIEGLRVGANLGVDPIVTDPTPIEIDRQLLRDERVVPGCEGLEGIAKFFCEFKQGFIDTVAAPARMTFEAASQGVATGVEFVQRELAQGFFSQVGPLVLAVAAIFTFFFLLR